MPKCYGQMLLNLKSAVKLAMTEVTTYIITAHGFFGVWQKSELTYTTNVYKTKQCANIRAQTDPCIIEA